MPRVPGSHMPALYFAYVWLFFFLGVLPSRVRQMTMYVFLSFTAFTGSRDSRSSKWFRYQHTDINQLSQKFSLGIINILNLGNMTSITSHHTHTHAPSYSFLRPFFPSSLPINLLASRVQILWIFGCDFRLVFSASSAGVRSAVGAEHTRQKQRENWGLAWDITAMSNKAIQIWPAFNLARNLQNLFYCTFFFLPQEKGAFKTTN